MNVNGVHRGVHTHRRRKRIGRGPGSGVGKTAGRGHKGQRSNPGYAALPIFEGGTMPLVRRIPKRGFTNTFAPRIAEINVGDLNDAFQSGDIVSPEVLRERGIVKGVYDELKVLGDGELSKQLKVAAHRFSKSAREKIQQAGGDAQLLPGKVAVAEKQAAARKATGKATATQS